MPLSGARKSFFGSAALILGNGTGSWDMHVDESCEYLDQIAAFQADSTNDCLLPNPAGLYIAGVDPFWEIESLERLLLKANQHRMVPEVVTSISWVNSARSVDEILIRVHSFIQLLTISVTRSDIEIYGLAALNNLLVACRRANTNFQLHVSVVPGQAIPREILTLEVLNEDTSVLRITTNTDGAAGADRSAWPEGYLLKSPPRFSRCAELMGFVIVAGGDVYPCISGVGAAQLRLGNVNTHGVRGVLEMALQTEELKKLRQEGPFFLYDPWLKEMSSRPPAKGYTGACDFHRQWLSSLPMERYARADMNEQENDAEATF